MKRNILISLLTLAALLTACTDDPFETPSSANGDPVVPEGYYFVLDGVLPQGSAQTRVAYTDINHSYFEEGDRVGIYAIDDEGKRITDAPANAPYRVTNVTDISTGVTRQVLENVNPGQEMPRGHRYVIYYPYDRNMTFERLRNLTHRVQQNQHTAPTAAENLTAYEQSDLLWDVAQDQTATDETTHYVKIRMDHAMANIILNVSEEYLAAGSYEKGYEVYVVNTPNRADGINLTLSLDYQDAEGNPWRYNTSRTSSTFSGIKMWYTGLSTSGDLQFRAAIPACQTIPAGTAFLQIQDPDGTDKQFQLKSNLSLRPGKNYIFTIRQTTPEGPVIPDMTDDDSWVLDVLDPETGEPVGLLCREYLRYQPGNNTSIDERTGKVATNGKLYIHSQAWVFYNLKPGTTIPDLNQGTVLRFIYDIHLSHNTSYQAARSMWPLPHRQKDISSTHQGLFTPEHGFEWTMLKNEEGYYYGISASKITDKSTSPVWDLTDGTTKEEMEKELAETNYYMHGGRITWDGSNNQISDFTQLPENVYRPTNSDAKTYGHIAIDGQGNAFVSYAPLQGTETHKDKEGNKIGFLNPHYLIDRRMKSDGTIETNQYPLVKIGYNQFWISKSLRTTTLTDGTELICYNKKGDENNPKPAEVNFTYNSDGELLDMGYIYMVEKDVDAGNNTTRNYDPYNDPIEMQGVGRAFRPSPLYNTVAISNEKFIPRSEDANTYYIMPDKDDIETLEKYYGPFFTAKLWTRQVAEMSDFNEFAYDKYTALTKGEIYHDGIAFSANVSGLNLHAIGYSSVGNGPNDAGGSSCIILKSNNDNNICYMKIASYQPWDSSNQTAFLFTEEYSWAPARTTQFFAQVRLFMKYRNQTDNSFSITTSTRSVSGSAPAESRNVYIPIQAID
ncbi:fimbrillin family protein [Bacteroides sp. ET71]|uniref:fimbrillin family protein n=1 Tax=Bacteroides sp. ET71 TaxID=2939421 RepID=UPI0020134751|nr:fimbrillin family protein [Bacteroides sp. ET71]MCL1615834.1 fimbrillin family protein [Bacteroides sp. ET71]